MTKPPDKATRLSELAKSLNCFTEHELAELAGVKLSTLKAWRHRGQGPAYILLGNRTLYKREAVVEYINGLAQKTASRRSKIAKALL